MNDIHQKPAFLVEIALFAEDIATRSRAIALRNFRHPLAITTKADESPVTIADREVEQALRQAIGQRYPTHGILGEEYGTEHADAEFVWSIDPIDGTRSFVSGHPLWGTLLGLLHRGHPVFGLIDIPVTSERWVGMANQPATLDGVPCHTRDTATLANAILYATDPDIFDAHEAPLFNTLSRAVYLRRYGGDCYSYGLLASGCIDLVMEAGLQPYDYLAVAPIIKAAGGIITDWEGKPLTMHSCGRVLAAANAGLHQQALACIHAAVGT
ncbi:histidinol-phosphatase [Allopusillimonas ginsengisoli]|uniref:histidinol-phosphatase n=1 Tax=Allopusillimonas ginsengisoli TaxID=453575 RepID=UPI0010207F91|nr:histidinol-phosphatase [Allopusillimonas ginsengisoli]TEA77553.1 histidinol-phosphatase [Allopusillimonas ginsengisoli]